MPPRDLTVLLGSLVILAIVAGWAILAFWGPWPALVFVLLFVLPIQVLLRMPGLRSKLERALRGKRRKDVHRRPRIGR